MLLPRRQVWLLRCVRGRDALLGEALGPRCDGLRECNRWSQFGSRSFGGCELAGKSD